MLNTLEVCQFTPFKLYSIADEPLVAFTKIEPLLNVQSVVLVGVTLTIVGVLGAVKLTFGYVTAQTPLASVTLIL